MDAADDGFAPVDALSTEYEPRCSRPSKRKRAGAKQPGQHVPESDVLRAMLGRPKCGCKQTCLSQFVDDDSFNELVSFRKDWSALHKLDQDAEASWSGFKNQSVGSHLIF